MTKSREQLETELADLDIPMVSVDVILEILGDAFDVDPVEFLNSLLHPEAMREMGKKHGNQEIRIMNDLLGEGLESTTQIPHIRRGIGIYRELAKLDD